MLFLVGLSISLDSHSLYIGNGQRGKVPTVHGIIVHPVQWLSSADYMYMATSYNDQSCDQPHQSAQNLKFEKKPKGRQPVS
eukprot:COSAG03_NODE_65_length_15137_cov_3.350446_3_plen_81_part_00